MYTQYAETLLKTVSDAVNNLRYDVTLAKNTLTTLMPQDQTEGILLQLLFLLSIYLQIK